MRDASAPALLSIENVGKRFNGLSVLEGLSLTLASGESLGLAGRTGCGKTTLLHIVSGFLRPEEGRVWFRGRDLTGWPPYRIVRTGIARTFHHVTFFAPLTVAETLRAAALHRRLRGRAREDAVTFALETVDLGTLARAKSAPSRPESSADWTWPARSRRAPTCSWWMSPVRRSTREISPKSSPP